MGAPRNNAAEKLDQQLLKTSGRLKILLLDDEVSLLRALKRSLGKLHDLHLASHVGEAFECLTKGSAVDLIVTDLTMPEIDGIQFYQKLVAQFPQFRDRVIFMSGGVFSETIQSFLEQSGMPILPKPFTRGDFESAVARILVGYV